MADKQDTGKSTDRAGESRQRFRHSRKLGLVRALTINLALIATPLLVYYVVVTRHSSDYTDQRSLRALQEIATQLDNRLDTLKNILGFASDGLQRRLPASPKPKSKPKRIETGVQIFSEFVRVPIQRFSLVSSFDTQQCNNGDSHCSADALREHRIVSAVCRRLPKSGVPSAEGASGERLVVAPGRTPRLTLLNCDAPRSKYESQDKQLWWVGDSAVPVIETTFAQMIENTLALSEIPVILVASEDGEVYAQLVRNHAGDPNPPAHAEVPEQPTITNLREILAAAHRHAVVELLTQENDDTHAVDELLAQDKSGAKSPGKPAQGTMPKDGPPDLPVTLDTHLAGTQYRAYVLPYPLRVPACNELDLMAKEPTCDGKQRTIYLVGLRKSGPIATATASLSPLLLLAVLLALIAACLLWPFLRHALLEPNDAVTWRQVRILGIVFLVLAALGVLVVRASLLGYYTYEKMDHALDTVSTDIDKSLSTRIHDELGILHTLEGDASKLEGQTATAACDTRAPVPPPRQQPPEVYPIAESFFETDKNGVVKTDSLVYDAFSRAWPWVCTDLDLSAREYFYLLKNKRGIPWGNDSILLQRLFNKPDGKKILQLAAVRQGGNPGDFDGVSAVNIGTIGVVAPVLPLGIEFAIFERSTGTVVFHSDDNRSLVENFYTEIEHDPTLASAVDSAGNGTVHFDGRYQGANTAFVYRTMSYSPWGLAVFYRSSEVSAVLALSVISALAVTLSMLAVGLALAHAVIRLARRRHSWLWPQWRLRDAYPTASLYLSVASVCEFHILRHAQSGIWQVAVLFSAPLFVLTACFSALSAQTPQIIAQRPRLFRHGLSLAQWSLLLHGLLLIAWVAAAWASGRYWVGLVLVLAFLAWVTVLYHGHVGNTPGNLNPWRRDLALWPSHAMPTVDRAGYRVRYLLFVLSLTLVIAVVPTLAIFDRTFEWYVSSALHLARADTRAQWDARLRKMNNDVRAHPGEAGRSLAPEVPEAARALGGFGVTLDPGQFHMDGQRLFGVRPPASCIPRPAVLPLGVWEREMRWDQRLLERLRLQTLAAKTTGPTCPGESSPVWKCAVQGTIHELHAGHRTLAAVLDAGSGLGLFALLMLLLNFSARHVTGISLPWSGRFGPQCAPMPAPEPVTDEVARTAPRHILLLQPNGKSLQYALAHARGSIRNVDAATDPIETLAPGGETATWIIRRVEIAILDPSRRLALLGLIEMLVANPDIYVVAISEVSPVYRIARPHAYPGPSWPEVGESERLRWIDLFTHFHKVYSAGDLRAVLDPPEDACPAGTQQDDTRTRNLEELIRRETRALWPCLRPIRDALLDRLHAGAELTDRDVIEFVSLHGEVHYRKAWEYCTRDERLALYQLAQGKLINMSNHRVVEHLLRRGLVVFEPEPRIKSISMAEFIPTAELPGRMESWAEEAAEGLWQSLRVPFFVVVMLVLTWIAYSFGTALGAIMALLATPLAVIGQALRLFGTAGITAPPKQK